MTIHDIALISFFTLVPFLFGLMIWQGKRAIDQENAERIAKRCRLWVMVGGKRVLTPYAIARYNEALRQWDR
jgi:hypothetical protein